MHGGQGEEGGAEGDFSHGDFLISFYWVFVERRASNACTAGSLMANIS
jgi:hypothetical protein